MLAFLCALDDPGLRILATHRIVRGSSDALEAAVARSFETSEIDRGALGDIQPGIVIARDGGSERWPSGRARTCRHYRGMAHATGRDR